MLKRAAGKGKARQKAALLSVTGGGRRRTNTPGVLGGERRAPAASSPVGSRQACDSEPSQPNSQGSSIPLLRSRSGKEARLHRGCRVTNGREERAPRLPPDSSRRSYTRERRWTEHSLGSGALSSVTAAASLLPDTSQSLLRDGREHAGVRSLRPDVPMSRPLNSLFLFV